MAAWASSEISREHRWLMDGGTRTRNAPLQFPWQKRWGGSARREGKLLFHDSVAMQHSQPPWRFSTPVFHAPAVIMIPLFPSTYHRFSVSSALWLIESCGSRLQNWAAQRELEGVSQWCRYIVPFCCIPMAPVEECMSQFATPQVTVHVLLS